MPPFVANENLVTTLWTEFGSLAAAAFLETPGEFAYLASSPSCCGLDWGRGTDSVRSREPGCWLAPSPIFGSGRATSDRLFYDLRSLV